MKYILHNQTRHPVTVVIRRGTEQVFTGRLDPFRFRRLPHEFKREPKLMASRDGVEAVPAERWDRR